MIRFLLRFVGLLLLALGFIFLVYDGIRSISDGGILLTKAAGPFSRDALAQLKSSRTPVVQMMRSLTA